MVWWIVAAVVGIVTLADAQTVNPLDAILVLVMPVALVWGVRRSRHVRPLRDGGWRGAPGATAAVLLQPRRISWAFGLGFATALVMPGTLDDAHPFNAAGATALFLVLLGVLVAFPKPGGLGSTPLAVAFGFGPKTLPRGTRHAAQIVVALAAVLAAWSLDLFGEIEANQQFMTRLLLVVVALCINPKGGINRVRLVPRGRTARSPSPPS